MNRSGEPLKTRWRLSEKILTVSLQTNEDDYGYVPFTSDSRICVCTLHSAKGLEFRALHLGGMGSGQRRPRFKEICVTRGSPEQKLHLPCITPGDLPGYLEGAYAAINPPPEPAEA